VGAQTLEARFETGAMKIEGRREVNKGRGQSGGADIGSEG
jgi:hypothetical protein